MIPTEFVQKITLKSINTTQPLFLAMESQPVIDYLMNNVYDPDTIRIFESFYVLFVNTRGYVTAVSFLSQGNESCVSIDPKMIFKYALLSECKGIILSHNHPSNITTPSFEDKKMTRQICEIGKLLQITVLDHIIVGTEPGSFYSFADNGNI